MPQAIIEMITASLNIFSEERKRHFENKTKKLMKIILDVEDSDFYSKDMEAKGQAERQLLIDTEELRKEWILEIAKK
jgi:hypothetical protein